MATYNGWTEKREYRVWAGEDLYSVVSVDQHTNGRVRVFVDGDVSYSTSSLADAYMHAQSRVEALASDAEDECLCHTEYGDQEDKERCEDFTQNVYNAPHGVRTQIVDEETNQAIQPWEL